MLWSCLVDVIINDSMQIFADTYNIVGGGAGGEQITGRANPEGVDNQRSTRQRQLWLVPQWRAAVL